MANMNTDWMIDNNQCTIMNRQCLSLLLEYIAVRRGRHCYVRRWSRVLGPRSTTFRWGAMYCAATLKNLRTQRKETRRILEREGTEAESI